MAEPTDTQSQSPAISEEGPYRALYRRYRPQTFSEVRGQEHVTRALLNAVRDHRVAHAYLFSGPRGTGKTSTARILAMALNCLNPIDGEPDGTCSSCVGIREGSSLDVFELDAASNRKLDEMRDLLSRVSLGTPGRWKVYIVDEVHQLTADAASALLKTLEEPPGHVVFVLATTDPQKVMPTIRSRTQHFEFRLLAGDVLTDLLVDVSKQADLGVTPEVIDLVVRKGRGSARDALSALDQVAAAGGVADDGQVVSALVDALGERDLGGVLKAMAEAAASGRDPRRIASEVIDHLRNGFLALQAPSLVLLPQDSVDFMGEQAKKLGLAALVRAMEILGQALIDMRDSVDPRVTLEVALVRIASPAADTTVAALVERIERLEAALASGGVARSETTVQSTVTPVAKAPAPAPAPASQEVPIQRAPQERVPTAPSVPATSQPLPPVIASSGDGPAQARAALGALRQSSARGGSPQQGAKSAPKVVPAPPAPATPVSSAPAPGGQAPSLGRMPTRDELTTAWADQILPKLRLAAKAYVAGGRFTTASEGEAVLALPDKGLVVRAESVRPEVEAALTEHFGTSVTLKFMLDEPESGQAEDQEDFSELDPDDLVEADVAVMSPEQRLLQAFPGAEEVSP